MVNTRVAQVNNVSSAATMEQLRTLFGFLGKIEDIRLFPKEDSVLPVTVRICFVRFEDPTSVGMAQHLSNTVFLDKALNVIPFSDGVIPEESKALQMVAASSGGLVSMMNNAGASLLPTPPQPLLSHLSGAVTGFSVPASMAPGLDSTLGLPVLPPLQNVDPTKVEEIRRTVYVGNLDSGTVTAEQLLTFFQKVGEVKYVRMAGDETQPTRFAFVEFSEPASVINALGYNGVMFAGRPLKINHSNNAIVKPPGKTQEAIQKEMAQTMKQVRDAQALIQAAIDPELKAAATKNLQPDVTADIKVPEAIQNHIKALMGTEIEKPKKKSRSRSPKRGQRSRSRRSRSRSGDRHRSRSRRSRSPRRRSRSPRRRSPIRRRSRSRSKHRRSRSKSRDKRSKSREKRKRSKTPPRGYRTRRSRSRSKGKKPESSRPRRKTRSPSPRKRSRSKSTSRSPRRSSKHRKDKKREKSREKDRKDKESRSSSSRKKKEKESTEKEASSTTTPGEAGDDKKDDKKDSKVKRDYDEEEKGFDSQDQEKGGSSDDPPPPPPPPEDTDKTADPPAAPAPTESGDNVNTEDMDMDMSD